MTSTLRWLWEAQAPSPCSSLELQSPKPAYELSGYCGLPDQLAEIDEHHRLVARHPVDRYEVGYFIQP